MLINEELIKYALFRKHSQENHQNLNAISVLQPYDLKRRMSRTPNSKRLSNYQL